MPVVIHVVSPMTKIASCCNYAAVFIIHFGCLVYVSFGDHFKYSGCSFNCSSLLSIVKLPLWFSTITEAPLLARGCHCSPCNRLTDCSSLVNDAAMSSMFSGVYLVWACLSCSPLYPGTGYPQRQLTVMN